MNYKEKKRPGMLLYVEFRSFVVVTQYFQFHLMICPEKTVVTNAKWILNAKVISLRCVSMSMALEDTMNIHLE